MGALSGISSSWPSCSDLLAGVGASGSAGGAEVTLVGVVSDRHAFWGQHPRDLRQICRFIHWRDVDKDVKRPDQIIA